MKKKSFVAICIAVFMLISSMTIFTGCDFSFENDASNFYTVQYTDDAGTHRIKVKDGKLYSLDSIPTKNGYTFMGLYDAEAGGTQYVSANGDSLFPYNEDKDLVLFPQFKVKEYSLVLDYQGAEVTGSRQFTVAYGASLPELPKDLSIEHNEFFGWYTKEDCKGIQVADKYGLIPGVSVLNDTNFDLSGESVYLYAGFEIDKYTVTLCFVEGVDNEVVEVPYNTPINEIISDTRVDGDAVLTWSKTQSGEIFNGRVTEDITLYAIEYAPVLDFDSNGGEEISHIIARSGTAIDLPTPTKDSAKFSHWEDKNGKKFTSTKMPITSTTLKAVWQSRIVLDSNGGSGAEDVYAVVGDKITLPTPEKDSYVFAGWYTEDKELFSEKTMPEGGCSLRAGWYREKTVNKEVLSKSTDYSPYKEEMALRNELTIDLSEYLSDDFQGTIKVKGSVMLKHETAKLSAPRWMKLGFYSAKKMSDSTVLMKPVTYSVTSSSYEKYTFAFEGYLTGNKIYGAACSAWEGNLLVGIYRHGYYSDMQVTVTYADTSKLYL